MDQSNVSPNYAYDAPHYGWNGSCNLTTTKLIHEYIDHYTKEPNKLYVSEQISQIITMYIRNKLDNEDIVPYSSAGLNIVRSNYHSDLKQILGNLNNIQNLLIDVYVNELFLATRKKMSKTLIKAFVEKDKETIDIINQFIKNNINDVDIYTKLLVVLSDVKHIHIQYIN